MTMMMMMTMNRHPARSRADRAPAGDERKAELS